MKLSGRIPELDGIRGVAIALVLVLHLFSFVPAPGIWSTLLTPLGLAWTGVDLFFVLSGFLIGGILLDARESTNYFQVFYIRRFFRIVPIYVALLLSIPAILYIARVASHGSYSWLSDNPLPWYSYWTFTQNLWMGHNNSSGLMIIAVTWSLAIEEQFYLTLPLMIRLLSKRRLLIFVLSGICFAPILRTIILFFASDGRLACYVLMPCRADALLLGVLAAILLRDQRCAQLFLNSRRHFYVLLLVLASGMAYLAWHSPSLFSPLMQKIGFTWVALFYATVLVFVLIHPNTLLSALFRNKALRWLGGLAYGTYLLHQTVLGFIVGPVWGGPFISDRYTFLRALAALIISLLIASLSCRYFELPLIRIGHKWNYKQDERAPATLPVPSESQAAPIESLITDI